MCYGRRTTGTILVLTTTAILSFWKASGDGSVRGAVRLRPWISPQQVVVSFTVRNRQLHPAGISQDRTHQPT